MKTTRVRRRPHLNLGVKKITRMIFLLLRGVSSRLHRNNTSKKEEGENKTKRHHQKLKMLETIARETSRQIHAQCRDRGELVDAVLDRYRDIIDVKNQQMEEMRTKSKIVCHARFCKHAIRTRRRGKSR